MKIGFIGAGNMASAIMNGLINSGFKPSDISAGDADSAKLSLLKEKGINVFETNSKVVNFADIIVLAVKPAIVPYVLKELKESGVAVGKILVSIAAGISSAVLKDGIGQGVKVVRTMPNTPAMVGEGMTVICTPDDLSNEEIDAVKSIFIAVGKVEILDEKLIDAVTAVSGSGPAYICMMIEAMADGGVLCGLPRDKALKLAAQTVMGTSKMVLDSGIHPAVLKDMVCSPSGTTIEAVQELENCGTRAAYINAVQRAAQKSVALGNK